MKSSEMQGHERTSRSRSRCPTLRSSLFTAALPVGHGPPRNARVRDSARPEEDNRADQGRAAATRTGEAPRQQRRWTSCRRWLRNCTAKDGGPGKRRVLAVDPTVSKQLRSKRVTSRPSRPSAGEGEVELMADTNTATQALPTTVERGARRVVTGIRHQRTRAAKTRRVEIQRVVKHSKYGKFVKRRTVCYIHDEKNDSALGDTVADHGMPAAVAYETLAVGQSRHTRSESDVVGPRGGGRRKYRHRGDWCRGRAAEVGHV